METDNIIPVILCGGSGTRLWPLSRENFPKQYISLYSQNQKSLLQQTQERLMSNNYFGNSVIICNQEHRFIVADQMREIKVKPKAIILEPEGRNTAPAITLAALNAINEKEDPILLILASDHLIKNNKNFFRSIKSGVSEAKKDMLVTFGVIPKSAETGFGYIQSYEELNSKTLVGSRIKKFVEKPDKELAEKFLREKSYSWNSGIFIFKAKKIISEIKKFHPEMIEFCTKAIDNSVSDLDFVRVNKKHFCKCPSISIDKAIMEKTKYGVVVPLNAQWSDIGNWSSLLDYEHKNKDGNLINGRVVLKNVENSLFRSESKLLVGLGLRDIIAVETNDAVLVMDKNFSQKIGELVTEMKISGFVEASKNKKGFRPWGTYTSIASGKNWQVKLIEVNSKASLSLQKHKYRSEHWIVVKGKALVKIEEEENILSENQSTYIPAGFKHQLSNPGKIPLQIIEVQSGTYLGEDDITRFTDMYGRLTQENFD